MCLDIGITSLKGNLESAFIFKTFAEVFRADQLLVDRLGQLVALPEQLLHAFLAVPTEFVVQDPEQHDDSVVCCALYRIADALPIHLVAKKLQVTYRLDVVERRMYLAASRAHALALLLALSVFIHFRYLLLPNRTEFPHARRFCLLLHPQ